MPSKTSLTKHVRALDVGAFLAEIEAAPELLAHRDERGRSWLHLAASIDVSVSVSDRDPAAAIDIVGHLLDDHGFDIDEPAFTEGDWHATPLWFAAGRGRNRPLVDHLLARGCDPNHCLWTAVFSDDADLAQTLIDHGADVNAIAENETPLIHAITARKLGPARVLLANGADPDVVKPTTGRTSLHNALLRDPDIALVELLIDHGARGDIPDPKGQTVIDILGRKRDPAFRALVDRF